MTAPDQDQETNGLPWHKLKLKIFNLIGKIIAQFDFRKRGQRFTCENMIADLFAYSLIGSLFNSPMICVKLLIGRHYAKWFICQFPNSSPYTETELQLKEREKGR